MVTRILRDDPGKSTMHNVSGRLRSDGGEEDMGIANADV